MRVINHLPKIKPALIATLIGLSLTAPVPLVAGIIAAQVSVADVISLSESVQESVHASITAAVTDVLAISESVQESVHASITVAVTDVLAISESVQESVQASVNAAVTNVGNLSDFVVISAGIGITGTAQIVDSLRTAVAMNSSQVFSIVDSPTTGLVYFRSDPVGLAESVAFLVQRPESGGNTGAGTGSGSGASGSGTGANSGSVANAGNGTLGSGTALAGDIDRDLIRNEIDGRIVNGRFVDESNSFSSEFTDQHLGGSTFGLISDRDGLSVALADADDPDVGLQASVSGRGGTAILALCDDQFHLNLTAGDSVLMTCGSLNVTVLTGEVEVDLGQMLAVTLSVGATAKVTDLGNGRFSAENSGISGLVTAFDNGNAVNITPGERVEIGKSQEAGPLSTPELGFLEAEVEPTPSTTSSLIPSSISGSPPTPLPQPTARPEPAVEPESFLPLLDDSRSTEVVGAIALGTIVGAAFIAAIISLIGLVRGRGSRSAGKRSITFEAE